MPRYLIFLLLIWCTKAKGQGCVAIRNNGNACFLEHLQKTEEKKWILGFNHRYFRSYKHFIGTDEQKQRVKSGTEVINRNHVFEIGVSRIINPRWSLSMYLPLVSNL